MLLSTSSALVARRTTQRSWMHSWRLSTVGTIVTWSVQSECLDCTSGCLAGSCGRAQHFVYVVDTRARHCQWGHQPLGELERCCVRGGPVCPAARHACKHVVVAGCLTAAVVVNSRLPCGNRSVVRMGRLSHMSLLSFLQVTVQPGMILSDSLFGTAIFQGDNATGFAAGGGGEGAPAAGERRLAVHGEQT